MLNKFSILNTPARWYFKNPEDGFLLEGKDLKDVASKVRRYRAQNEFENLEYLENVIENFLCSRPENRGSCEKMPALKRGLYATIKAGVLLIKQMMYNSFASQEVADSRALVCVACSLNTFPDKTAFIKWGDDIAEQTIGDRRSKYHDDLGNCQPCSCLLKSKVFYNEKIKLKPGQESEIRSKTPSCWQLPENCK